MMLQAICTAYTGSKPASCSQLEARELVDAKATAQKSLGQRIKRAIPNGRGIDSSAQRREEMLRRRQAMDREDHTETRR
jgi:hypothetical protein